jgi:hypothetical protein
MIEAGEMSASSSPSLLAGKVSDATPNASLLQSRGAPLIQDLGGPQMKKLRTESLSPESKGK